MAQPIHFNISINASPMHVWKVMLDDNDYRAWAKVWHEGSQFRGSWTPGTEIIFCDDTGAGIAADVVANDPGVYVETRPKYELGPGSEPRLEHAAMWVDSRECYTLSPQGEGCLLEINLEAPHMPDAMGDYMAESWPKALLLIKELCETAA
jgi:hypothetical protein